MAKVAIFSGGKKVTCLPYLDNEFQLVARIRQDSKQFRFIWLIPLVDGRQSTFEQIGETKTLVKNRGTDEEERSGRGAMAGRSSISFVTGDGLVALQGPKVAIVDVRCTSCCSSLFFFSFVFGYFYFCSFWEHKQEVVCNPAGSSAKSSEWGTLGMEEYICRGSMASWCTRAPLRATEY